MLAWAAEELTANLPWRRWLWTAAFVLLLPILIQSTAAQTRTWKDSETLWTSALQANPEIALAENNLGYIFEYEKGQLDEALKRYAHAVNIRPRYVEARINLGNAYAKKAQRLNPIDEPMFMSLTDEALRHYNTALEVRPDYELARVNLCTTLLLRGELLLKHGELPQAESNFRAALEKDPRYVDACWMLGAVLCQQNRFEGIDDLRKAVEIDPHCSPARWRLGLVLCQRGQFKEGIDALRQTVEIDPDFSEAWQTLAQVAQTLFNQGRYDEAVPCCQLLVQHPATASEAWQTLAQMAQILFNQGRYDEALPCCEILLQHPATARKATETLGYLYYVKHQPRKALEYWTSFLDDHPDSLPVLTMTAWLLATDPDPAVRNGEKSLTLARRAEKISQDPRVLVALAAATAESKDFTRAAQIIELANRPPEGPFSEATMSELQKTFQSGKPYLDRMRTLLMMPDASAEKAAKTRSSGNGQ